MAPEEGCNVIRDALNETKKKLHHFLRVRDELRIKVSEKGLRKGEGDMR